MSPNNDIAPDFKELLPKRAAVEEDDRPVYWLWTFDPEKDQIIIDHNENRHPADHLTHDTLAPHVHHPDKVHGYAYAIKGGYRVTDDDHKKPDTHVEHLVLQALRGEHPEPPLPSIRYHRV